MISIIMPVYNTPEKYLKECIDSILAQTYKEFEILIINDGSSDKTCNILSKISKKDLRINVFNKENGGVSSARNLGLEKAKGEYIAFVDGDDVLEPFFLEQSIGLMKDVDLVIGKVNWFNSCGIIRTNYDNASEARSTVKYCLTKDKESIVRRFMYWPANNSEFFKGFRPEVWCKLYRKDLIEGLKFNQQLPIGEDGLFFLEYLLRCNSFSITNSVFYNYRINDESAMWKFDDSRVKKYKDYIDATILLFEKYNLSNLAPMKVYYEIKELASCYFREGHLTKQCYKYAQKAVSQLYKEDFIKQLLSEIHTTEGVPVYSSILLKHRLNGFQLELLRRRLVYLLRRR